MCKHEILLRNYDKWQSLILFDVETNKVKEIDTKKGENINPVGKFKLLNNKLLSIYQYCGEIQLNYNKNVFLLNDVIDIDISYNKKYVTTNIKLNNNDNVTIDEIINTEQFVNDFTQTDGEDFSILKFIYNIFKNKERQNVLKEVWV